MTDSKLIAGLQARAALAGYELQLAANGSFILSRWGMVKVLADAGAVEALLKRLGQSLDIDAIKAAGLNSAEHSQRLLDAHNRANPPLVKWCR